ncbi:MAG: adenylate kinase [Planctomycetota bacterium]|jgi:adenylate kinase
MSRFVFVGPPGVGKGTQAKLLAARDGLAHISTGDMLRSAVKNGTPAGLKAKPIMDRGDLVPDNVVLELVGERLEEQDACAGFILDGYPRNPSQAADLGKLLKERGMTLSGVVSLELNEDVIVPRLSGRRVCSGGHVFHATQNPPKQEGVCDTCGEALFQRDDDKEDVVRDRMRTYHEKTAPLISFYRDAGLLITVNAAGAVEEVTERVKEALSGDLTAGKQGG